MNSGLTSVSPFLLNDVKDLEIFDNELSKLKKLLLSLRHIRDKDFVELFNCYMMNEIEDKELLDSMSDEECFITMMKELNTPIMRRHLSDDLKYCIMRVLKNEKVSEFMSNYDKSVEFNNNLFV